MARRRLPIRPHEPGAVSFVIYSLTEAGARLAGRLATRFPQARHQHRPAGFVHTAQQAFARGEAQVFICATGIVVRALAPVLTDKRRDPAVVVLDEAGRFVIPLLSNHEGGAAVLAAQIATALDATLVSTSASDYSAPVYCLGLGSDRGCPLASVQSLYTDAIHRLPGPPAIAAMASIDLKQDEPCMRQLAEHLQIPFHCYPAGVLRQVEHQLSSRSDIVFREVGCYGVAEAAALVAASALTGQTAELVLTKQKNARATLAVARSYLQPAAPMTDRHSDSAPV